ncbi:hypothetical protein FHG87_006642 [Trinorchestia longiramus]|nr:hypothetical protein FHG87_006642 [Trinorchestia longiramus]
MLWRSVPLGDHQVERFIIRDSDAKIIPREAAAVEEWVRSGKYVHLMRDHPFHNVLIMGGLFGIYQPPPMRDVFENIRKGLFVHLPQNDQYNLERVMPRCFMEENALQHSSFWCTSFGKSVAFPTQRQNGFFVGNPMYRKQYENSSVNQQCPTECRPAQHQDWLYC